MKGGEKENHFIQFLVQDKTPIFGSQKNSPILSPQQQCDSEILKDSQVLIGLKKI